MSKPSILVRSISRFSGDHEETLKFGPGVNVITGGDNTGKTKWLQMLDFLLGDTGTAAEAFGDLADKYDSLRGLVTVGTEELLVERRWKQHGNLHKVWVNEETFSSRDFSDLLLEKLGVPRIHYPKGNPYEERSWPQLTWRQLARHVYRQGRFWSDLADRQPEVEQLACILQFLGLADKVFPEELGKVVDQRRHLYRLQARKEQFQELLDRISSEWLHSEVAPSIATADTLDSAVRQWTSERDVVLQLRTALLQRLVDDLAVSTLDAQQASISVPKDVELTERRVLIVAELERLERERGAIIQRIEEQQVYRNSILDEVGRLRRTQTSAAVLADLHVSHCPVCDQEIQRASSPPEVCYLCHRSYKDELPVEHRLDFEIQQLTEEAQELKELLDNLQEEHDGLQIRRTRLQDAAILLEQELQPLRQAVAMIIPPELSTMDAERGRLEERIRSAERLRSLLLERDELSAEIDQLAQEVQVLQNTVNGREEAADFEQASDILTEGMNTYYNLLNEARPGTWDSGRVSLNLSERRFSFTFSGKKWSSVLGDTRVCWFLLSYHFGLLRVSSNTRSNYPGLCIIDFPPELAEAQGGSLNYLVDPFVRLLSQEDAKNSQLIVAGQHVGGIAGASETLLSHTWV